MSAPSSSHLTPEQETTRKIHEGIANAKNLQFPSNENVVRTIERMKTSPFNETIDSKISPTGKRVHEDLINLSSAAQKVIVEKNPNDALQKMTAHAAKASKMSSEEFKKYGATASEGPATDVRYNLSLTYSSIIKVIAMLFKSNEFRGLMKGLIGILMDIIKHNVGDRHKLDGTNRVDEEHAGTEHPDVEQVASGTNVQPPSYKASEITNAVQKQLRQVQVPQEYKEELVTRLKDALVKFQDRPEYQNALETLLGNIGKVLESSKTVGKKQKEKSTYVLKESPANSEWDQAFSNGQILLESVFGGNSMQPLIDAVRTFFRDMVKDDNLSVWLQNWIHFIKAMLSSSEYVQSERFRVDARVLSEDTNKVFKDRYKGHADNVVSELNAFLSGASQDPTNQEFMDELRILWEDVFLDENGNFTIKTELLDDLARVIPDVASKIMYVDVPKYEKSDDDYYILLDQIVLNCRGLVPQHIRIVPAGQIDLTTPPRAQANLSLHVSHVQVSAKNVLFAYEKKFGPIKFADNGRLDFDIPGDGISLDLTFKAWVQRDITTGTTTKGFDLEQCDVRFHNLDLHFHHQRHHVRYWFPMSWYVKRQIQKRLSRALSEALRNVIDPSKKSDGDATGTTPTTPTPAPGPHPASDGDTDESAPIVKRWSPGDVDANTKKEQQEQQEHDGIMSRFRGRRHVKKGESSSQAHVVEG